MNKFIRFSSVIFSSVFLIILIIIFTKTVFADCITYHNYTTASIAWNNYKSQGYTCSAITTGRDSIGQYWKVCCTAPTTTTIINEVKTAKCGTTNEFTCIVGIVGNEKDTSTKWEWTCTEGSETKKCSKTKPTSTSENIKCPATMYVCPDGTSVPLLAEYNCEPQCPKTSTGINSCHKCNGTKYCGTTWTVAENELCDKNNIPGNAEQNQIVCGDCINYPAGPCEGKTAEEVEAYCKPTSGDNKCSRCSDTYKDCRVTYDPINGACGTGMDPETKLENKSYSYDSTCTAGSVIASCSTPTTIPDCDATDKVTETQCTAKNSGLCGPTAGTKTVTYSQKEGGRQCRENNRENVDCEINACRTDQECVNNQCQCKDYPRLHDPYWTCYTSDYSCRRIDGVCGDLSEESCKSSCRTTTTKITTTTTTTGATSSTIPTTSSSTSTITTTTSTTKPSNNTLTLVLGLDGIGTTGDNANPNDINCTEAQRQQGCGSTLNPTRPSRQIYIDFYDTNDKPLNTLKTGYADYQTASGSANYGKFVGTVDLGVSFTSGNYIVRTWSEGYLKRRIPGILAVNTSATNQTPIVRLVTGDMDVNNKLDINDYADLVSCIEGFNSYDATKCNSNERFKIIADLDDNGTRNEFDYNLYMRDWANQQGE